ncbi:MAG: hydrogenase expression/formation protein HupK [Rhodobacter sp.]|nr:hydrogenase expression/formation protein HupK [Rhodobacter sp.]
MLDIGHSSVLYAQPAPGVPVARLIVGRDVEDVATLLPRLFNLCRAAQSAAVEAALGRQADCEDIGREILRDHLLKFHVSWPAFFGSPPCPLPADWAAGGPELRNAAFGPAMRPPATAADFYAFLHSELGYAPVLKNIGGCFAGGEAVAEGVPPVTPETIWADGVFDNSVAVRAWRHPVMAAIASEHGRGPLWRAAARLFDIAAVIDGDIPPIVATGPGEAIVPAARGSYAVKIALEGNTVTSFDRVTPTDHLLADGGVLDRTLASLPAHKAGLGPLLLDILDPCSPVRLREVRHA